MPSPLTPPKPWYRDRWPWLLIAGPAIVVVAGLATAWIAVVSDDGLVAPDYYKRGLLINKEIERSSRAAALQLGAIVVVAPDGGVEVELTGLGDGTPVPAQLAIRFGRAARAGQDAEATLPRTAGGRYAGRTASLTPGRWLVAVEGDDWRLATGAVVALPGEVRLGRASGVD